MNTHTFLCTVLRGLQRAGLGRKVSVLLFAMAGACIAGGTAHGATAAKAAPAKQNNVVVKEEVHYDRLLRVEQFSKYDKAVAHQIQQDLALIYHDDPDFLRDVALGHKPLTDDIVGPVTLFWMQRYCYVFKIEPIGDFTGGLIESISGFAGFATRHPKEKGIILTRDFSAWVEALPSDKKKSAYDIRRSGSDAARLGLVDEYLKRPARKPVDRGTGQIFSYRIDQTDIDNLRGKPGILVGLASFPAKPFADVGEFDAAITAALKDVPPAVVKTYLSNIESVAKVGGYRVTDVTIQKMTDLGIPDDLVHALEPLQGVLYVDSADLDAAMRAAAADAKQDANFEKYRVKISSVAELGTYSLDQDALKKLDAVFSDNNQKPILPIPLVDILMQLEGVNYPTADLFDKAAQAKIWYSLGACPANIPDYAKYVRGLMMKDDAYNAFESAVAASLGAGDEKSVADMTARFDNLKPLRKMSQLCTSEQTSLAQTVAADIYQYYRATLSELVRKAPPSRNQAISWSGGSWGFKDGAIISSCGCVLNDLSGQVYAFYPFWLDAPKAPASGGDAKAQDPSPAQANTNQPQVIDFNVLSRVGFIGFTFDDKGNLKPAPGRNDVNYDFAKVAQGFQTQMDWVIRRDEWSGWNALSTQEQTAYFKKLRADIADLMKKAGGSGVTLFFDGYPSFDDTSTANNEAIAVFDQFVDDLGKDLRSANKGYGLNIVLRQPKVLRNDSAAHATAKANDYDHMLKLLGLINPQDNRKAVWTSGYQMIDKTYSVFVPQLTSQTRNHILLLIEEPTTDSKKRLRLEIEQALHGEERHTLLSGVIPVIEFDGRNWEQLEDDIIYFKDNFDGIGFWPVNFHQPSAKLPSDAAALGESHCNHGETVEQCLVKAYQGYNLNGREDSAADKFVCQYHMWFRALFLLQLVLFLVAYLVPLVTCYLRGWMDRNFKLLVANFVVMGIVGAMLFAWDPGLEGTRAHVLIIIALLLLVGFEALRRRQEFIARTVKPSRSKSAMLDKSRMSEIDANELSDQPHRGKLTQPAGGQRHNAVLKAILRLRTFLESGRTISHAHGHELRANVITLQDFLDIEEREGATTRVKIRKATQVVIENLGPQHESKISSQKMRRLAILLWSYLNGNIVSERRVLQALEPFLEQFEDGNTLDDDMRRKFSVVLQEAHHCVEAREETETELFDTMRKALSLMSTYLENDRGNLATISSAMQVVWNYVDHDESLHGRKQIEETGSVAPMIELANNSPLG
ncbi:MAG TPA: hypothetical protein VIF60_01550 [Burkholderiaceae bacterium]